MEDKDYYILDQESIDLIVASRKQVRKTCKDHNVCATCPVTKFEIIGDIDHNDCYSINITRLLLGDNVNATEFYKTQYREFGNMCIGRGCNECKIKKIKNKYEELSDAECLELYIAIKLLKDV